MYMVYKLQVYVMDKFKLKIKVYLQVIFGLIDYIYFVRYWLVGIDDNGMVKISSWQNCLIN